MVDMKRSPLKRVSKRRATQNKVYAKVRAEYLDQNPDCEVCGFKQSTQIHHRRGRFGSRLNDTAFFLAVCFECHNTIHTDPIWAYGKGHMVLR